MAGKTTTKRPDTKPKKTGRPTDYTPELALDICDQLSDGQSLRSICISDTMPLKRTVLRWLQDDVAGFSTQYARAKAEGADSLADDIQDIGERVLKGEVEPQAARVAIDAKKWIASKLKPKKYGDKIDVTSDGEKIGPVLVRFMGDDEKTE